MKNIMLIALALISQTVALSQSLPETNGKIVFEKVFEKEGISKEALFLSSKQFFVDNFKNSNYVIKSEDKEAGRIVGKGFADMDYFRGKSILGTLYPMHFTIQTDVKEGKARIRIYDAYYKTKYVESSLEKENKKQSKGVNESEKKKVKYEDWSKSMSSKFHAIIDLYETKINDNTNTDDSW